MKILDLRSIEGDVLLFGGAYSNLQATRALVAQANALGIGGANSICTGDVVAYCADPAGTLAAIRRFGCPVVAGNMEINLGSGAVDCGCGFEDGSACDLASGAWFSHANAAMTADDRAWMAGCPDVITFVHGNKSCAVIHGGATDVARFVWPTSPEAVFAEEILRLEARVGRVDMVVAGHSGIPFVKKVGAVTWVNAGVIGMPPHDGDPRTAFAVLGAQGPVIHRLAYDHDAAARAMQAAGLVQGYETGLESGHWPSEDVLPPEMRLGEGPAPVGRA